MSAEGGGRGGRTPKKLPKLSSLKKVMVWICRAQPSDVLILSFLNGSPRELFREESLSGLGFCFHPRLACAVLVPRPPSGHHSTLWGSCMPGPASRESILACPVWIPRRSLDLLLSDSTQHVQPCGRGSNNVPQIPSQ